jgi:hypothetical protein
MFDRLQVRGIGGKEEQVDVVGHAQALGAVPAGTIEARTICLCGEAPTSWAKAARSTSKRGMLTEVARWNTVRPEVGCTKATR